MITRSLSILVLAIGPACGADDGSPFVDDTAEGDEPPATAVVYIGFRGATTP